MLVLNGLNGDVRGKYGKYERQQETVYKRKKYTVVKRNETVIIRKRAERQMEELCKAFGFIK